MQRHRVASKMSDYGTSSSRTLSCTALTPTRLRNSSTRASADCSAQVVHTCPRHRSGKRGLLAPVNGFSDKPLPSRRSARFRCVNESTDPRLDRAPVHVRRDVHEVERKLVAVQRPDLLHELIGCGEPVARSFRRRSSTEVQVVVPARCEEFIDRGSQEPD
jgi:hypothetical protein